MARRSREEQERLALEKAERLLSRAQKKLGGMLANYPKRRTIKEALALVEQVDQIQRDILEKRRLDPREATAWRAARAFV